MDIHRKLQIFNVLKKLHLEAGLTVLAVLHGCQSGRPLPAADISAIRVVVADGEANAVLIPKS